MKRDIRTAAGILVMAAVVQFAYAEGGRVAEQAPDGTNTPPFLQCGNSRLEAEEAGRVQNVEVCLMIVQFPKKTIEGLSRTNVVRMETLSALYAAGEGELVAAPVVSAHSGTEASVRGVVEYVYPTSFSGCPVGETSTNMTELSQATSSVNVVTEHTVMPQDFATREVGTILTVLPEVSPEGRLVSLTLSANQVFPPTWKDYAVRGRSGTSPYEQPFFPVFNLTTQLRVECGTPALIGGGSPNADGTKVFYAWVTASILGCEGKTPPK